MIAVTTTLIAAAKAAYETGQRLLVEQVQQQEAQARHELLAATTNKAAAVLGNHAPAEDAWRVVEEEIEDPGYDAIYAAYAEVDGLRLRVAQYGPNAGLSLVRPCKHCGKDAAAVFKTFERLGGLLDVTPRCTACRTSAKPEPAAESWATPSRRLAVQAAAHLDKAASRPIDFDAKYASAHALVGIGRALLALVEQREEVGS